MSSGDDPDRILELVKRAVAAYKRHPLAAKFTEINEARLQRVYDYLTHLEMYSLRAIILEEGVGERGYSLFLHEHVELLSYDRNGIDAFNLKERKPGYRKMHAHGLLAEHRFLEEIARERDFEFSLCELVTYNPHGAGNWPSDWEVLVRNLHSEISYDDNYLDASHAEAVRRFYQELGFREVV